MPPPRLPEAPNEVWARRYQICRLLGEGSRKRVYLARDTRLDRDVALALIKSETLDPASVARVQRETQTMGSAGRSSAHRHRLRRWRGGRATLHRQPVDGGRCG